MQSPFNLIGKTDSEIRQKIDNAYKLLFLGNPKNERICFEWNSLNYIVDIGHSDIRSEGMSYGMFIAARLGKKELFRSLWEFTKNFLQNKDNDHAPYFAWQVRIAESKTEPFPKIDPGAAPDGEEYIAAALLIAARKFQEPEFGREAESLLKQMAHKVTSGNIRAMFDPENFLVLFSPMEGNDFTDPSYHTLAFYRLFARESGDEFWKSAYRQSLAFLKKTIHPETGLSPDYAEFDGTPKHTDFFPTSECFSGDAWRVALNLALDFCWEIPDVCEEERKDACEFERSTIRTLLRFFDTHRPSKADYRLDGSNFPTPARNLTTGLVAMNAAATLALDLTDSNDIALARPFLDELWNASVPTGTWRYYDGLLYLLGFLALSD